MPAYFANPGGIEEVITNAVASRCRTTGPVHPSLRLDEYFSMKEHSAYASLFNTSPSTSRCQVMR